MSEGFNSVSKAGMKISITWEALQDNPRIGRYEPTGVKWVQWLIWAYGLVIFKAWTFLNKRLDKSRFFYDGLGRDWDEPAYREFSQKKRWVEDE